MNDREAFAQLMAALRPWLDRLVLVGGWCHRLHRVHPLAGPAEYPPVTTFDADIALPETSLGAGNIGEALRRARFEPEYRGDDHPPVTRYLLDGAEDGFRVEFLAPMRGSGVRRDGTANVTLTRAGVTAQRLRHVDVLLVHPWTVAVGPEIGVPVEPEVEARIANPVSFIAQKLLIRGRRPPPKQAQDALYIHDTIDLFGDRLDDLRGLWRDAVRPSLPDRTARRVEALAPAQFAGVSDVLREAARMPPGRTLAPERMRQVCAYGLAEIFGS